MSKQLAVTTSLVTTSLAIAFLLISVAATEMANAQVAVSVGVRETYDDNVFLENGQRHPNPFVLNDAIEQDIKDGQLSILGGDPADGKKNGDVISNVNLSASGSMEDVSSAVKGGWNLGTGLLLFNKYTDYSRVTVDALVDVALKDTYLPKPFFVSASTGISSRTSDVSVANGSAARAAQTWNSNLRTGINDYVVAKETFLGAGYNLNYNKFLGQWVLSGNTDKRFQQQGSDYLTNSLFSTLDHQFTKSLNSGFAVESGLQTFTKVQNSTLSSNLNKNSLDRYFTNITWDSTYVVDKKLSFTSSIGTNITSYKNQPAPFTQTTIGPDGKPVSKVVQADQTQSGLIYTFGSTYTFEPGSSLVLQIAQNRSSNINGGLITIRNYSATLNKSLSDRFFFTLGNSYLVYGAGNSVSNGLDRYEGTASLSYALTQDTNLSVGYNYATQNADDSSLNPTSLFQSQDYDSNRFYINISSGIIGKKS